MGENRWRNLGPAELLKEPPPRKIKLENTKVALSYRDCPIQTAQCFRKENKRGSDMRRFRQTVGTLTVIFVVGILPQSRAGAQSAPTVTIQTFQFRPNPIEVKAGMEVTWVNQDDIRHTITSGTPENKDGRFDAPLAGKGTKFTFAFSQPGTYNYFCDRHQHMSGQINVK